MQSELTLSLFAFIFFFKQKTAYEMLRSLVGSEMCIRDRASGFGWVDYKYLNPESKKVEAKTTFLQMAGDIVPVSYTHLTLPTIYSV